MHTRTRTHAHTTIFKASHLKFAARVLVEVETTSGRSPRQRLCTQEPMVWLRALVQPETHAASEVQQLLHSRNDRKWSMTSRNGVGQSELCESSGKEEQAKQTSTMQSACALVQSARGLIGFLRT